MGFKKFLGAIAPLGGAILDAFTGHSANRQSMKFAERMSSTQWQRGVKDMLAAGINPMLAVSQGGASAPTVKLDPITKNSASTALAATMQRQQLENMEAQTNLLHAQERNVREDTSLKAVTANQVAGSTQHLDQQIQKTAQETKLVMKQLELTESQLEEKNLTNAQLRQMQPLLIAYQKLVNDGAKLGMTQKEIDEKFARAIGEESKWLRLFREMVK